MRLGLWSLALSALWASYTANAAAQSLWVFVPAPTGSETPLDTHPLESGVDEPRVLTNSAAATTVQARHSSEAPKLSEHEIERVLSLVQATKESILNEDKAAIKLMHEIDQLAPPLQDFLRRDAHREEDLFHACVLSGGLLLRAKRLPEAQEQFRLCARVYPGRKAQASPEIRSAYAKAVDEVAAEPHGSLDVAGGEACGVRVNGALVGKTPLHLNAVRVGTARIQLECEGVLGRLHGMSIEPGENRVSIDPEFDRALSTSGGRLVLNYSDAAQRERSITRDSEHLSEVLGAHVVLLVPLRPGIHRVLALNPRAELGTLGGGPPSSALIKSIVAMMGPTRPPPPAPPPATSLSEEEHVSSPPPAIESPRHGAPQATDSGGTARAILSGTLIAASAAGIVTAWILYAKRLDQRATSGFGPASYADIVSFHNTGNAALWFAAGGSVLLAGAEYFLLSNEQSVPTSAWAWFGGGFLLAAGGVALMAHEGHCTQPSPECQGFASDSIFGALLALHSIPLLTVPLNYWLRAATTPKRRIELGFGPQTTLTYRF